MNAQTTEPDPIDALQQALDRWNEVEKAMAEAHREMIADLEKAFAAFRT